MPLTRDETDTVSQLFSNMGMRQAKIRKRNKYYKGAKRLRAMGLSVPPEMRHLEAVVNWCRVCVDSLAERLTIEGFRTGDSALDERWMTWWKRNRMNAEADRAHIEALIQGAAFIVVGIDPADSKLPKFTVESSQWMQVELSDDGREVVCALRTYLDGEVLMGTLYLPDATVSVKQDGNATGGWSEVARDTHDLGRVPVVPVINRARIDDRFGESEMTDVMSLVDAACRTLTNLGAAGETLAVPSRYIFGVTAADFVDSETGEAIPAWEAYMGRLNAYTNSDGNVIQLSGADLTNFTQTLDKYASLVSSVTGLPMHYLGLTTQTPASADAIRSGESRHVKRAERKQETFDDPWCAAMELATLWIDGELPDGIAPEVVWRDPSTPTVAAKTDAVVKLFQAGLLPVEAAWMELGYGPEKRQLYRDLMSDDPMTKLLASVGVGGTNTDPNNQTDPPEGVNGDPTAFDQ